MRVKINEIRKKCEQILIKSGVSSKATKIIFSDYLEGELLNKKSHGLSAFVNGVYDIERILESSKTEKIKITKDDAVFTLIDGQGQAGQLVAEMARKILIKKAKKFGIAMVGTYNTRAILRPGSQAEALAKHDLIALIFHNGGGPLVAPYGGIDPIISTDPIGFAVPTTGLPIVADMATSVRAYREIQLAKLLNKKLPNDAFINKKGEVTLNPDDAFAALPFGGYKGFALGILFEILTGPLVNSGFGLKNNSKDGKWKYRGALYLAIDPSKFVNLNKFKRENTALIKELKNSKKMAKYQEILIPGERAYRCKAKCLKQGWFDVDKTIIEKINKIYSEL
ncbi:MAG TPA: hypothetical protein DEB09_00175 [Candidatus Magasanikbacteria bacterium]|nr:hypothetical protein [Candidatus Magasanikbacteria bacterium]